LHYISLINFVDTIHNFGKIIKKGGRGFITFNLIKLIENTQPHEFAMIFNLLTPVTINDYINFIEKEITKVTYKVILSEILLYDPELEKYNLLKGTDWPEYKDFVSGNFNDIPDKIINEIQQFNFQKNSSKGYNDEFNGNIRIVFEV
jgi:hypothetical protein